MSIDQLKFILSDIHKINTWMPPLFGKWKKEFEASSYTRWACDELISFMAESISPHTDTSVDEFIELTTAFKSKMIQCMKTNPKTAFIFEPGVKVCTDVSDVLQAMK
jgi:hypothetical protein